jgi:FkbM family methyltransferase
MGMRAAMAWRMRTLVRRGFAAVGLEVRRLRSAPTERPVSLQGTKTINVGGFALAANESHPLEEYLADFPLYSQNLPRIASYLHTKYPEMEIVDVGANIGDTAALLRAAGIDDTIHAVEGVDEYYRLLVRNAKVLGDVRPYRVFLGESSTARPVAVLAAAGTAKLGTGDTTIETVKLSAFVAEHAIAGVRLLKLDTDGLDLAIIRGGLDWIADQQPVLFFEYDQVDLRAAGDDGLSTLQVLRRVGYDSILYYDNFGRFLCATSLANEGQLRQLHAYIAAHQGAFPYYDVCVFHSRDADLSAHVIEKEEAFFASELNTS